MTAITTAVLRPPPDRFPPGTVVGAYRSNAWSGTDRSVAPTGAADGPGATVLADGSLSLTGLIDQATYFGYAAGAGVFRFTTRHSAREDLLGSGSAVLSASVYAGQRPVTTRGGRGVNNVSNGTVTVGMSRIQHIVTGDSFDLRFIYVNFNNGDADGASDITIRAGAEYPTGQIIPVYFKGVRDVVIQPGGQAMSDPIGLDLVRGDAFYSRTNCTITAGTWPNQMGIVTANGEGVETGVIANDKTLGGAIGGVTGDWAPSPKLVLGSPNGAARPTVAMVGDSIMDGQGDNNDRSFVERALNNGFGYLWIAKRGEAANLVPTIAYRRRRVLLSACQYAVCNYGTNDLFVNGATFAQLQGYLIVTWRLLTAHGIKTFQTTITPRNQSSDAWATTANQSQSNAAAESYRLAINDWLRGGAPLNPTTFAPMAVGAAGAIVAGAVGHPLTGYFETADTVETARNSGLWKVTGAANYATGDGTHPTAAAHTLMAAAIKTALFV